MPRLVVCPVWKEARGKHWVTDVIFPDIIQKCSLERFPNENLYIKRRIQPHDTSL